MANRRVLVALTTLLLVGMAGSAAAQYDPPPGYYDSATGTGTTLKSQLNAIMTTGHIQQTYGSFRYQAADYDEDPNNPSNILLVYNRQSVPSGWDSGATWNREHVWPQSRQPGSASNSSTGNLGDPFALRPCNPSINGSRGNMPFGNYDTTGSYRSLGSYWFPGDVEKGDIARNLFYSATRYQSTLTLVDGFPSGNQMGDLQSLLRWHYTDPPDEFERRRNHVIYGYSDNRNAYIDRPEFAWSVFGGGNNDSKLYVGNTAPGDGASSLTADLGRVIRDAPASDTQPVILHKIGSDPTYYSVAIGGDATASASGMYNTFDINGQSQSIDVGLTVTTSTPGLQSGTVTIDNLDVDGAGTGQGSFDGDDVITIELQVLDHSEASFSAAANEDALTIDFGVFPAGSGVLTEAFAVHNLESAPGFSAALDVDSITDGGDTAVLFADVTVLTGLAAGSNAGFLAFFDTDVAPGTYQTSYVLEVSDEDLPGAQPGTSLMLALHGGVVASGIFPFDDDGDGDVDLSDLEGFVSCLTGPAETIVWPLCSNHDADVDNDVDLRDFAGFQEAFTGSLP